MNFQLAALSNLAACGSNSNYGLSFSAFFNAESTTTYTLSLGVGGASATLIVNGAQVFTNTGGAYPGAVPFQVTVTLNEGLNTFVVQYASGIIPGNGQSPAAQLSLQASGPGYSPGSGGADQYINGFQCGPQPPPAPVPSRPPPAVAAPPLPPPSMCENPRAFLATTVYCSYPGTSLPINAPESGTTTSQTIINYSRDGGDLISGAQAAGGCSIAFAVNLFGYIEVPNGVYTFTLRSSGGAAQLYIDGVLQSPGITGNGQEAYTVTFSTATLHKVDVQYALGPTPTVPILILSVQAPGETMPTVLTGLKQCGPVAAPKPPALPPSPPAVSPPPAPPLPLLPPSPPPAVVRAPPPSPPNPDVFTPPASPPPICSTLRDGLVADAYFDQSPAVPLDTNSLVPIRTSITPRIDYYPNPANLRALALGAVDNFAVRFSGFINVIGGNYTFQVQYGGGGAQLVIDNTPVVTLQGPPLLDMLPCPVPV